MSLVPSRKPGWQSIYISFFPARKEDKTTAGLATGSAPDSLKKQPKEDINGLQDVMKWSSLIGCQYGHNVIQPPKPKDVIFERKH